MTVIFTHMSGVTLMLQIKIALVDFKDIKRLTYLSIYNCFIVHHPIITTKTVTKSTIDQREFTIHA